MIRERFDIDDGDSDADEVAVLDISCKSGEVRVERGPAGIVEVEIDTNQPDHWRVVQRGRMIEVVNEHSSWLRSERSRVRVTAPDRSDVDVRVASANVTVALTATRASIETASGDLRLERAASLTVKSASGDIRIGEIGDESALKTASGDVSAEALLGDLSVTTASGDIRVEHAAGRVHAATASGDIAFGRYEGSSLTANTMSGDVTVGLPSGRTVDCDARSLSGRVELPEQRGEQRGSEPPGGPRVQLRLKSVSGDVRIRRAD